MLYFQSNSYFAFIIARAAISFFKINEILQLFTDELIGR